jgi:beta-fructofuranosidase
MSGGQALIGDYDTALDRFVPTSHARFNFGPFGPGGVHAPSATPDGKGGVTAIFNMNPAMPTVGWNQIMTLPRKLTLLGNEAVERDTLAIAPAGDVESLRGTHQRIEKLTLPANQEVVLEEVKGNAIELLAEIDANEASMVEMNVLRSPGREEYTRIAFYPQRGYRNWERYTGWERERLQAAKDSIISIDNAYSSILPEALARAPESAPVYLGPEEPLQLRIFIDRSVVEVFVNGKQCVAVRVYPGRKDSLGVSMRSVGKGAVVSCLDVWQMESVYE